jgi:AbrB family looped-hinge helix DNA binding protein
MSKSVLKKQATVTSKGQITIPHEVRRKLGVRAGDKLVFAEDAAGFRVETVRTESPFTKYRGGRKSVVQAVRKLRGK